MAAPTTTQPGSILEPAGFRSGALWIIAATVGAACLPGLAIGALPSPDAPFTAGLLIILLAALAAEIAAVAVPTRPSATSCSRRMPWSSSVWRSPPRPP